MLLCKGASGASRVGGTVMVSGERRRGEWRDGGRWNHSHKEATRLAEPALCKKSPVEKLKCGSGCSLFPEPVVSISL